MDKRKKILKLLEQIWDVNKRQRFGQLLFNYTPVGRREGSGLVRDPFHVPDDDFIKYLEGFLR